MFNKLLLPLLLLFSVSVFSQKKCFEEYKFVSYSFDNPASNITDFYIEQTKKFKEYIYNCEAPDFRVTTINGDTIELNKLKGNVVVVDFWFIGCSPCISEIPALNKLVADFMSKNVVFIGMSRSSKKDIINNFLPKNIFNFKIVPDCGNSDEVGSIADKYKIYFGWPTIYILDKKGKVKFVKFGGSVEKSDIYEILKPIIEDLL